jgi:hypothetical protein
MTGVSITVRRREGRIKAIIEGLEALDSYGEIYLTSPREQLRKIRFMKARGHDPFKVPKRVSNHARGIIKAAVFKGGKATVLRAISEAIGFIHGFIKMRIRGGSLGTMAASTRRKKLSDIRRGKISSRYGVPPPYGIHTGSFYEAIQSRIAKR